MEGTKEKTTSSERPPQQRYWLLQVTALALFLGVLLGTVLRAQQNFKVQKVYSSRYGVPPSYFREQQKRTERLQKEIQQLNEDKSRMEKALADSGTGSRKMQTLNKELQDMKLYAGLAPVTGAGVVVTLRDADPKEVRKLTAELGQEYTPAEYVIHDLDVLQIVNELRAAGAEAIAINDQRITATSPIRCVGPTVLINSTPVGVPLEIKAIGDPVALASGLQMAGGVMDPKTSTLALLKMVSLSKSSKINVPAFGGPTSFQHGQGVPAKPL